MSTVLYFSDLCGPPRHFPRIPWGSMDPRLRTYVIENHQSKSRISTGTAFSKSALKNRCGNRLQSSPGSSCKAHQGVVIKLSKDGVGNKWGHSCNHGQQGEHLPNLVLLNELGHQWPEERELAMANCPKALDEVKLPKGLERQVILSIQYDLFFPFNPKMSSVKILIHFYTKKI